jgi:hypothetical protein
MAATMGNRMIREAQARLFIMKIFSPVGALWMSAMSP